MKSYKEPDNTKNVFISFKPETHLSCEIARIIVYFILCLVNVLFKHRLPDRKSIISSSFDLLFSGSTGHACFAPSSSLANFFFPLLFLLRLVMGPFRIPHLTSLFTVWLIRTIRTFQVQ
jgi:hypothetical protein